eukprot:1969006-Pyramimonas_sp.AAC.1
MAAPRHHTVRGPKESSTESGATTQDSQLHDNEKVQGLLEHNANDYREARAHLEIVENDDKGDDIPLAPQSAR